MVGQRAAAKTPPLPEVHPFRHRLYMLVDKG